MPRKLERPAPPYLQIAGDIREAIRNGDLVAGDHVPSVREIVREYHVAMATAHRAVRALHAEGYVRTEPGVGNVVTAETERGGANPGAWLARARRTGKVYPPGHRARIIRASVEEAGEQVAGALGVEVGAAVLRRDRVRLQGEAPVALSTSWFRGDLAASAPALLELDRIEQGTFAYLAEQLGRAVASWQDQYEPGVGDGARAEALEVPVGSPAVLGRNWVYDDHGDVLEYGESITTGRLVYRGDLGEPAS
jgi:DNA-binding GntR family transcriptional regulator